MARGFYFETSNNKYFYNDENGYVECKNNDDKSGIIYGESVKHDKCNAKQVEEYLKIAGFKHLILMITQDCNLRCKYCAYSGEYSNQREHTRMKMSFETAKKAIDKYYEEYKRIKKIDVLLVPTIGLYGGEPLLEMELVKEIVNYVNKVFNNGANILITTNGTLLNEDMAKFLVENKILLTVSLNGYKEENDRMRVYADGRGTYDDIYKNLMLIKNVDEDYYKTNVTLSGVMDTGTDLVRLNNFYEEHTELPGFARTSMVLDYFTDWYSRYSNEEKKKFADDKAAIYKSYREKMTKTKEKISKIERMICIQDLQLIVNRVQGKNMEQIKPPMMKYTGMCVPGTKVAVSPDGELHCCEKINLERPFGNVETWVDYEKISEAINDYNEVLSPNCSKCPIQRFCPVCYNACLDDHGDFSLENIGNCEHFIEIIKEQFVELYELMENGANMELKNLIGGNDNV